MTNNDSLPSLTAREKRLSLLVWFRLSRIYNGSLKATAQHLTKWSLTPAQFDVLAQVGVHDRLTQQQLADKLYVTKGNMTQLLSKLEEAGLIKREQDWKTKYVSLTEQGLALFHEVVPVQEDFQASQYDGLNVEEKQQLLALLSKMHHGMNNSGG